MNVRSPNVRSSSNPRSPSGERPKNPKVPSEQKHVLNDSRSHSSNARKMDDTKTGTNNLFKEDVFYDTPNLSATPSETKAGETTMNSEMRATVPLYGIPSKVDEVQTDKAANKTPKVYGLLVAEMDKTLCNMTPQPLISYSKSAEYHKYIGDLTKGKVSAKDLQGAFEMFQGKHFSDSSCKFVVRLFDLDRAGGLDIKEFETLYFSVKKWVEAFNAYDSERSGFLTESEFDYALRKMEINFSKEFIKFLLTKSNPSNKKMSLDQFILFCVKAQKFTDEFKARDQNYSGNINLRYEDFLELIMRCV